MTGLREMLTNLGTVPDRPGEMTTTRGVAPSSLVTECSHLIDECGIVAAITSWEQQDRPDLGLKGGRKRAVSHRAALTGMLVLAVEAGDLSIKELHLLLARRLSRPDHDALGLPDRAFGYDATWRAIRRLADVIDPVPGPRKKRPTWAMVKAFREQVTPEVQLRRQRRANTLVNTLISATARLGADLLPGRVDLSVDATVYPIYGKRGHPSSKDRPEDASMSPEYLAGWHAKTEENRPTAHRSGRPGKEEYTFGYDLHLGVVATGKNQYEVPRLFTAAVLNTPGMTPGRCAVEIGQRTHELLDHAGLDAGYYVVDRGYSDQLKNNFHRPLEALDWTPVFSYKTDQLGVTGSHDGMPFVAGSFYCPGTPQTLLDAHYDRYGKDKDDPSRIDQDTYEQRRQRLSTHRMRQKQQPRAADSSVVFECPAAGPNPVATCPHKPRPGDGKVLVQIASAPTGPHLPAACANKRSVSVPVADLPKGYQQLEYNSPQHQAVYKPGRSQIEGENRILKDVTIRLADASQRRGRGYGLHCVIAAIKIATANLRELSRFLRDRPDRPGTPPPRRRSGRPAATGFADYALPPDQPTYIVGQKAPPQAA